MKSIRGRIILLFVFCLIFGGILTVLHYANMYSLNRKMVMMQDFDNLLNNILELRRYEKNFTYYRDTTSISDWESYLASIETSFSDLGPELREVMGKGMYGEFHQSFDEYRKIMRNEIATQDDGIAPHVSEIRDKGKKLVEYANKLIEIKQANINKSINTMLIVPVAYFSIFVLLTIIVFQLVNYSILKPLYLIRNATKHVALETFQPIVYHSKHENEITKLINAFNKMAIELETRQKQLLQSRKLASIGTFTSGIAHELNNPLNNISLTAESLQFGSEQMTESERQELLEDIVNQADRASRVVKNLLEFCRTEKPSMIRLDIRNVLDRTLQFTKNQLVIRGIQLDQEIDSNLPLILGKRQQLEDAFVNIIINAIQAMPDGGRIKIRAGLDSDDQIRIDISDTGVGIDPADLSHIFDPFYTTKEVGKGTGLGLSLVYGIVRAHGGDIDVESRLNEGTTFTIFLPVDTKGEECIEVAV